MEVVNEVLLAIKKQKEKAADSEQDCRLLQLLDNESTDYKNVMVDMLR